MDQEAPSLAQLTDQLDTAAHQLVETTRRFSAGQWRKSTASGRVADVVQALITSLAALEHAVEVGSAPPPPVWRSPSPAPYPGALPDRLAVVSNDLVEALHKAPDDWQVWYCGELVPVGVLAAGALSAGGMGASLAL